MKWTSFPEIKDCGILDIEPYLDERGYFMEIYNKRKIVEAGIPLPWNWVQENISFSNKGIQRGFHIQKNNPQGKLITCLVGRILDVCVDLRPDSPTYLQMTRVILDCGKPQAFYLPPGTAHGFVALEDSLIHYRCTTTYDKDSDGGVNAASPELAMVWPAGQFYRSDKDRELPMLVDYLATLP